MRRPWDARGLRFHLRWTRDFIRDFGLAEYLRVCWRDAWIYRLKNWRCWFGHELGPVIDERIDDLWWSYDAWRYCLRPSCEYCERFE